LPPVELCKGVRPRQAAKSRLVLNVSKGGASATIAVAAIGPALGSNIKGLSITSPFERRPILASLIWSINVAMRHDAFWNSLAVWSNVHPKHWCMAFAGAPAHPPPFLDTFAGKPSGITTCQSGVSVTTLAPAQAAAAWHRHRETPLQDRLAAARSPRTTSATPGTGQRPR